MYLIILVNQVHNHFHHHVLLLSFALCNHQSKGDECVVGYALRTVFIVKNSVVVEKPQEQSGGNAFVAVAEGVVLGDKIQKHRGFLLNARI